MTTAGNEGRAAHFLFLHCSLASVFSSELAKIKMGPLQMGNRPVSGTGLGMQCSFGQGGPRESTWAVKSKLVSVP